MLLNFWFDEMDRLFQRKWLNLKIAFNYFLIDLFLMVYGYIIIIL